MPTFRKVCGNALSFREKTEADIFELDDDIRIAHATVPELLRPRPISESIADTPFLIMTRLYVEFIHLKSLCVLHRRYMARGNAFSTKCCVDAGRRLVSLVIDVHKEFSPEGQLHGESWMFGSYTLNDFLLGVMVLCLAIHIRRKNSPQESVIDRGTETELLALLEQSHAICVEKSAASRDARRVSHAVRLTLNGGKVESKSQNLRPQSFSISAAASINAQAAPSDTRAINLAMLSLHPQPQDMQGDEATFGLLDPFNFMGNEFENIDFTMANPQDWPSSM